MAAELPFPSDNVHYSIYSPAAKRALVFSSSFAGLLSSLSGHIYFPALTLIARDLNVSDSLVNLSISTYMILEGLTPAFSAQISDTCGRRPVFIMCLVIFLGANIGLAIQNSYAALLVLRMVQSAGSSGAQSLVSPIVADVAAPAERGAYVGYAAGLAMLAAAVGPVIGGLMVRYAGWHSIFWLLAALGAATLLPMALFFPETCRKIVGNGSVPPQWWNQSGIDVLLQRRKKGGAEIKPPPLKFPNPLRPVLLLLKPECGFPLLYSSILACSYFATLALIPTQFSHVYSFNELQVSLCYLPYGIGALLAALSRGYFIDANFRRHAAALGIAVDNNKTDLIDFPIERARIEVAAPTIGLGTACTVSFGWMLHAGAHVSGPLIMLLALGFCAGATLSCIQTLMLDINPGRAGTVVASNSLLRCVLGAGATAGVVPLINGVGIGWAMTVFGGLNALFMPLLWYIMRKGPDWRKRSKESLRA
ncbi:major facilitator superfamily domain-containing protein [Colletotrichum navitas]|uniref:Major facilitator superfamily domain-containing protein n=1 Tax=Colletotrichum navitas TaxID=681940 RepID=A0AAD8PMG3_9PEZI|nr:major facilitator superfamily domain-containing protein [Colletotrichum navitas]KAK1570069.1 major facilitator superfamily domain-containing protein [Colletotrichum navitas]